MENHIRNWKRGGERQRQRDMEGGGRMARGGGPKEEEEEEEWRDREEEGRVEGRRGERYLN